ncbi:MAG TPA: 50S ribosomal protein L24 [Pirellulales bacterium]
MHIRVDDQVEVISGGYKGTRGKVKAIDREAGKVIVEGVALIWKHVKPTQRNPKGGRLSREMPIPLSKVLLVCPSCGKASRTGARYLDDGTKERFCKKCNASDKRLSPPRPKYAKKS